MGCPGVSVRIAALALAICLLFGCASKNVEYESYVQANRTDKVDEALVIILIKNPNAEPEKPDMATVYFVLRKGETKKDVFRNKHYPGRTYTFTASRDQGQVLTVTMIVEDAGSQRFKAKQRFASWVGF